MAPPIDGLFVELVQCIYTATDKEDRPAFRRVCHKWRDAASRAMVGAACNRTNQDGARAYVDALARSGRLAVLQWAHAEGCPVDSRMCVAAASGGHVDVLDWARNTLGWRVYGPYGGKYGSHHFHYDEKQPRESAQWLDTDSCAHAAAAAGQNSVIQWVREQGRGVHATVCDTAAEHGQIHTIRWMRSTHCPWDEDTCAAAARGGQLATLQWLRANRCPWDRKTYRAAVEKGHHAVGEWALANGCPQ
ncbi:Ankyrin repeat domain containing protein [Pandoravirus quercus]|uniref:Ankyrin repeat domain containing protein n=1 Tax=Pandoravirus quercus TaxID=2107709 RepID=A0A2U7U9Z2_9VIRU|nr:Ankyrin repeat domain containing protein [Pandoravirus quercus]AVK75268.1 Ankyrin repeat domain containing protein [Pandoravirus quercus]